MRYLVIGLMLMMLTACSQEISNNTGDDESSRGEAVDSTLKGTMDLEKESNTKMTYTEYRESPLNIEPIEGISDDFARGVDISTLKEMETLGQKYYDDDGVEKDLFAILAAHGVNYVRLRLWNDPYDVSWSKDLSKTGEVIPGAIGAGTNDLLTDIELAKRAKAYGMKVLLDFHYSDFWADPGKQNKPDAWQGLGMEALKQAVYDYTYESLKQMADENVLPDMVQIGNEVNAGLIWPEGRGITSQGAFDLLNQGSLATRQASKDFESPIKIMIHLAEGGDRRAFMEAFDALTDRGLDYDVIGASYYPYWHGTLKELELNLRMLEERYGKEVAVAEMAYGYGYDNGDQTGNIFNEEMVAIGGYEASPQGQAAYIRDVANVVASIRNDKGLGIFYWEPAWLSPEGAGWITGDGNAWENQALFDIFGRALPSLDAFYLIGMNDLAFEPGVYKSYDPVNFKIDQGQKVTLPYRVKVAYTDGRYHDMTVKWDNLPLNYNNEPDLYHIKGVIEDLDVSIEAPVEVVSSANVLLNGGFEDASLDHFTIDPKIFKLGKEGENPFTGKYALNYWAAGDFEGEVRYDASFVQDGSYDLVVFIMGASLGATETVLFAETGAGRQESKIEVTGFNDWKKISLENILVSGGDLTFGIKVKEAGGSWGWLDDFKLEPR